MSCHFPSLRSLASAVMLACCLVPAFARAELPIGIAIVRVEEDWEVLLGQPDANSNGPQISCTISPTGNTDGVHAVFELNHRSQPEFSPGGMQLQVWDGETPLASKKFPTTALLQTTGEALYWTQVIELKNNKLRFEILNGQSTTWGPFGGQGYMLFEKDSQLEGLNQYQPDVSVQNSGVCFASNRVQLLVLRRVRYVLTTGQTVVDDTVRVAHVLN